ncbi:MAG: hypothetical protein IRZ32_13950, partial [Solirubrobacteraceae bacterium]|nr:hypothetical protein [Solirubrobacteraceae bacterium]
PPRLPRDEAPTGIVGAETAAGRAAVTAAAEDPTAVAPAPAPAAEAEEIVTGADEAIRVLSGRRRPRHRPEDEPEPTVLAPGATRIGARAIAASRPATPRRRGIEPQRIAALIALLVAIAAFVVVVVLRVGL